MAIRIPRNRLSPQEPQRLHGAGSSIVPASPVTNAAAAAVRPAAQAAALAERIVREEQDRDLHARLLSLDVERRRSDAAILDAYGELRGEAAVNARKDALDKLVANARRVRSMASKDPALRDEWAKVDEQLLLQSESALQRHYQRERETWRTQTIVERVELMADEMPRAALGQGYDAQTGQLAHEAQLRRLSYLRSIEEMGAEQGWPREKVENEMRRVDGAALTMVVQGLVADGRPDEAERVLQKYDQSFPADLLLRAKQTVEQGKATVRRANVADTSQRLATQMEEAHPGDVLAQVASVDAAFQRGDLGIEVRDETVRRLRSADDERYQARMRTSQDVLQRTEQEAQRNGWRSLADIPPATRTELETSGNLGRVELFLEQGGQWVTTEKGSLALAVFAAEPQRLREYRTWQDLTERYRTELDNKGLAHLVSLWADATKQPVPPGIEADRMRQRVKFALEERGVYPSPLSTEDKPTPLQTARFERVLEATRTLAETMAGGSKVPVDVFEKALERVLGAEIRTAAGERLPEAALFETERPGAFYETPLGRVTTGELDAGAVGERVVDFQQRMRDVQGREATAAEVAEAVALERERAKQELRQRADEEWRRVNLPRLYQEHRWLQTGQTPPSPFPSILPRPVVNLPGLPGFEGSR